MVYAIIIILLVLFFLSFYNDRNKMLKRQVDAKGGMEVKYHMLIKHLSSGYNPILNVYRDCITIKMQSEATIYEFVITETFNKVHIKWTGRIAIFGTYKREWTYLHNYSQEIMCKEIFNHIEWVTTNLQYGKP